MRYLVAPLLLSIGCSGVVIDPEIPVAVFPFPDSVTAARGLPPMTTDSSARLLGDTLVQTELYARPAAAAQPMQLRLRVFARNVTSTSTFVGLALRLADCPLSLRVYRGTDRSAAPAWQSQRASGALRCPLLEGTQQGGTDVTGVWSVPTVLGDSLSPGSYSFTLVVRTADGRLFEFAGKSAYLTADVTPPTRDLSGIQFSAQSEIASAGPRMLKTTVTVRNATTHPVQLSYGACNVNLRLFRNDERSGSPVWRSENRRPPGSKNGYECIMPLYITFLAPGDSLPFALSIPMYEVIGDSLAAGRYYVSAELSLIDEALASRPGGVRALAAGVIDLTREADRLPGSKTADGLTFTATTRLVRGADGADTIRTLVFVTNQSSVRRTGSISRDCPVIPYAFRSAALRDSVPLQQPISYPNSGCYISQHSYAVEPGQSWVFGRDVALSDARAAVGPGHLWFTAWMPGTPYVMMAAGDVEIPR